MHSAITFHSAAHAKFNQKEKVLIKYAPHKGNAMRQSITVLKNFTCTCLINKGHMQTENESIGATSDVQGIELWFKRKLTGKKQFEAD